MKATPEVVSDPAPGHRRECLLHHLPHPVGPLIEPAREQEFDGRARFSFGISSTGKELYIYGAGYDIEVWDAATLQLRNTIDLHADTTAGLVVLPGR